jgi:hypothetical protein
MYTHGGVNRFVLLRQLDRAAAARHIHADGDHTPHPGLYRPIDHLSPIGLKRLPIQVAVSVY